MVAAAAARGNRLRANTSSTTGGASAAEDADAPGDANPAAESASLEDGEKTHQKAKSRLEPPEDPAKNYSPVRKLLHTVLKSQITESLLGLVIMINLLLLIVETDAGADSVDAPVWVLFANYILLGVYTIELCSRLFVMRLPFFTDGWCVMDFVIVGSDLVLLLLDIIIGNMPKISVLRAARLVRLARAFKALSMFPELALLLRGFVCAFKAIFWGVLLVLIVLTIWSILAVQLLHDINQRVADSGHYERSGCERCSLAFSSVWNSVCTFTQQLVAGDSWGTVSLPIIAEESWTFFFFLAVLVSVSLAIMNLILAVIVDSAEEARQEALVAKADEKEREWKDAAIRFQNICRSLDSDESGCLSQQELLDGWDTRPEFAEILGSMGLKRDHMELIFHVLDKDNSGDVNYEEFIDEMNEVRMRDVHSLVLLIKFYVTEMRAHLGNKIELMVERTIRKSMREPSSPDAGASDGARPTAARAEAWEPVGELPVRQLQPEGSGQGRERKKTDELLELKHVNQQLVYVMREMVTQTETHTKLLTNLDQSLPRLLGKWQPVGDAALVQPGSLGAPGQSQTSVPSSQGTSEVAHRVTFGEGISTKELQHPHGPTASGNGFSRLSAVPTAL